MELDFRGFRGPRVWFSFEGQESGVLRDLLTCPRTQSHIETIHGNLFSLTVNFATHGALRFQQWDFAATMPDIRRVQARGKLSRGEDFVGWWEGGAVGRWLGPHGGGMAGGEGQSPTPGVGRELTLQIFILPLQRLQLIHHLLVGISHLEDFSAK